MRNRDKDRKIQREDEKKRLSERRETGMGEGRERESEERNGERGQKREEKGSA